MSFILPKQSAFGLDISDYILRAVNIENNRIMTAGEINLPAGLIKKGVILEPGKVAELIKKLIQSTGGKKIRKKYVIACLPEQITYIKMINLPTNKTIGFQDLLAEEITKHIPYNLEEIYVDWQPSPSGEENKILIGVATKNIVNSYQEVLMMADLIPLALEIEAVAISRCLINQNKNEPYAQIILDLGFNRTSLILYDRQTVQFSISIPLSGDVLTKTIAKTLNLTYQQAERAKIVCGFDEKKCERALLKLLKSAMAMLINNINGAISFYQNRFTNQQEIKKIILSGGGANFKNLDLLLKEETGMIVEKGNILTNLNQGPSLEILPKNKYSSYVSAVGLALKNNYLK